MKSTSKVGHQLTGVCRDYNNLDDENNTYNLGARDIDDQDYDDIELDERRRVDRLLDNRDRAIRSRRGLPDAFLDGNVSFYFVCLIDFTDYYCR